MAAAPTPSEVEAYLRAHIPISAAMGVRVAACGVDGVTLRAPLAPNINHRATVFGGSASAVAILSAWAWLHFALRGAGLEARLVIQRNTVDYLAPIAGDFMATCPGLAPAAFEKFAQQLKRLGKARATLGAELRFEDKVAAKFEGDYVAVRLD
jgi:thioesterase domain-containing protein